MLVDKKAQGPQKKPSFPLGILLLLGLSSGLMIGVVFVDYDWTLYLMENRWSGFAEIMRRTIFEGGALGGSDPAIIYVLMALAFYGWSYSSKAPPWLLPWRSVLGFVAFTSLSAGFGFIQSLKWTLGRARPHILISENLEYSPWYEFGAHYVGDGIFFGSFPSGHTAVVALLLTLAYILIGDPLLSKKWRWIGWAWGVFVVVYSLLMVLGRSMAKAHWLSDGLGSLVLIWSLSHLLYYWILKIPQQRLYFHTYHQAPNVFRFWELRLCGYFLMIAFGIACILIALNAFQRQSPPWLATLLLLGLPLVFVFTKKTQHYYHKCVEKL